MTNEKLNYDKIEVLKGIEGVRKNPSMYLGDISNGDALHHMVWEILDNSIDEFMNGFGNRIIVTLHKDESISIEDYGRGIPCSFNESEGKTSLELALTQLHSGGKFNKEAYQYSGGLHGLGLTASVSLSENFKVIVWRDRKEYSMSFHNGQKSEEFSEKNVRPTRTGTFVRFSPDNTIFKNVNKFEPDRIRTKLRELSFLCKGLEIQFIDETNNTREVYSGEDDIKQFIRFMTEGRELVDEPFYFSGSKDNIMFEIAMQWMLNSEIEAFRCYTNNIPNADGGTHLQGFRAGVTRTLNNYIASCDLPKSMKVGLSGDDVREGLISIISIRHPDPKYSSQTKEKMVSDEVRSIIEGATSENLLKYLGENPTISKKIVTNAINAFKAREAAKNARETVRKTALNEGIGVLPGKLADCSSKYPERCELFICEGASAAGSMKSGRDREFQAILPLRGKILNVERCEFQRMIKNEELINIITVLGVGIGRKLELEKLRYHKIILATDADVDGAHIRTLILTFFFRQMPQLIMNGHVYIARNPLYRVDYRGQSHYLLDDAARAKFISDKNLLNNHNVRFQRFKGLGEMASGQIWETSMNPETRIITQVKITNLLEADRTFSILMGDQVEPRKDFVINSAKYANLDV